MSDTDSRCTANESCSTTDGRAASLVLADIQRVPTNAAARALAGTGQSRIWDRTCSAQTLNVEDAGSGTLSCWRWSRYARMERTNPGATAHPSRYRRLAVAPIFPNRPRSDAAGSLRKAMTSPAVSQVKERRTRAVSGVAWAGGGLFLNSGGVVVIWSHVFSCGLRCRPGGPDLAICSAPGSQGRLSGMREFFDRLLMEWLTEQDVFRYTVRDAASFLLPGHRREPSVAEL